MLEALVYNFIVAAAVGSTFVAVFLISLVAGLAYIDRH